MHNSVRYWLRDQCKELELTRNKDIIEVGSLDVNGSLRGDFYWQSYYGIDIQPGKDVDEVIDIFDFFDHSQNVKEFDAVICAEMLEHCKWPWKAVDIMYDLVKPDCPILLTTRGFGFGEHLHPNDYTRWSVSGMEELFNWTRWSDIEVWPDTEYPGVMARAFKR